MTAKKEYGDFQTPLPLAAQVVDVLAARGVAPESIVEPTCGTGTFLEASLRRFQEAASAIGLEINPDYFRAAQQRIRSMGHAASVDVRQADFFRYDWAKVFHELPEPILVVGNPPWVTASQLGAMQSKNLPVKSNFQNRSGFEAITGKANFDIAEWMLGHLLQWMSGRRGTIAMLLKQSVARKVLFHAWKEGTPLAEASLYTFDAKKHFGVSVEACLLVCDLRPGPCERKCEVYSLDAPDAVDRTIGYEREMLLSSIEGFERHQALLSEGRQNGPYRWRSGVKHDCARVMEFALREGDLANGLGERVTLEESYLYPMLKGSGVANGRGPTTRRMLVTQRSTGEPTNHIEHDAPLTWEYLLSHGEALGSRGSSIYRRRPRFSVFGVGDYTFAPWKVAICGLYKKLEFKVVGPQDGKPVVFDDTVYFLSCESEGEATLIRDCLHSTSGQEFLRSFIFWDSKRPITVEVLSRLDLLSLADELGRLEELVRLRPDVEVALGTTGDKGWLF